MEQAEWLAQVQEPIIEPDRPICDPHHHLWDNERSRYLLDELLADLDTGHNIVSTVFVECAAMYRADGPQTLRPVGETEFVNGRGGHVGQWGLHRHARLRSASSATPI